MKIEEGRLYFIKDEFLEKYGKQYNLMNNKVEQGTKRPTYFCFRDGKEERMLWFVPMSKQYQKYLELNDAIKKKIGKEPNNFVFSNNVAGIKAVFLIQNMFPTIEKYVEAEYTRRGQKVKVALHTQKEILQKATKNIVLAKRNIVSTYTNLPSFIKTIKEEIQE